MTEEEVIEGFILFCWLNDLVYTTGDIDMLKEMYKAGMFND